MIVVHGRQSSHYTRLVRLFAHELDVPVELAPIHALLSDDPATFAGNPALKLPALRDGDTVVWGSANRAAGSRAGRRRGRARSRGPRTRRRRGR